MSDQPEILTQQREAVQVHPPDLSAALDWREKNLVSDLNCCSVGRIVAFYPATQTADVSIVFKRILTQQNQSTLAGTGVQAAVGELTGEVMQEQTVSVSKTINYPVLSACPVLVLGGGTGNMTFPITAGDECLVLFCDRDIDAWFQGLDTAPPNSDRMHDFSDAIVLVGIRSLPNSIKNYRPNGPAINNGQATIAVEDRVLLQVGLQTLGKALDALCAALIASTDTHGDAFTPAAIQAIQSAQAQINAVVK